jgi:protein SCO1/2
VSASRFSFALLTAAAVFPAAAQDHSAHQQMMSAQQRYTRVSASYRVPDVSLQNQDGKRIGLAALLSGSEPVALNFIFTTCTTICPVMTATFSRMRKELGPDADGVRMVSISIDPEYDTPTALKEYAGRFNAGPNWSFLTGRFEDIIAVEKAFDAFTGDKTNHRPSTFFRGRGASDWVRIDGLANGSELAKEYRELARGDSMAGEHHHH